MLTTQGTHFAAKACANWNLLKPLQRLSGLKDLLKPPKHTKTTSNITTTSKNKLFPQTLAQVVTHLPHPPRKSSEDDGVYFPGWSSVGLRPLLRFRGSAWAFHIGPHKCHPRNLPKLKENDNSTTYGLLFHIDPFKPCVCCFTWFSHQIHSTQIYRTVLKKTVSLPPSLVAFWASYSVNSHAWPGSEQTNVRLRDWRLINTFQHLPIWVFFALIFCTWKPPNASFGRFRFPGLKKNVEILGPQPSSSWSAKVPKTLVSNSTSFKDVLSRTKKN